MSRHATTSSRCPPLSDLLLALDGELSPQRDALLAHLRRCETCRDSVDDINGALAVIAITSKDENSDAGAAAAADMQHFMNRLDEAKRQHASRRARRTIPWRSAVAASIAWLVVGSLAVPDVNAKVLQLVRRTFGFADNGSKVASRPLLPVRTYAMRAPEPVPFREVTLSEPTRPAPSVTAAPPRAGLAGFVNRTFSKSQRETGHEFIADLPLRVASVTHLLRELCAMGSCHLRGEESVESNPSVMKRYDALKGELEKVDEALHLIFGGKNRVASSTGLPEHWRSRTARALILSINLRELIGELLAYDDVLPADGSRDVRKHPMFAEIDRTFSSLWDAVNAVP